MDFDDDDAGGGDDPSQSVDGSGEVGEDGDTVIVPPINFAMVSKGIYRSGYPTKKNFSFLKRLGLKTVLYLCPEEYPKENIKFLKQINARLLQFGVAGNKV